MCNITSCSVTGLYFSTTGDQRALEKRILQAIKSGKYFEWDFSLQDVTCMMTQRGLCYSGTIRYHGDTGEFTINKTKLLDRLYCCF